MRLEDYHNPVMAQSWSLGQTHSIHNHAQSCSGRVIVEFGFAHHRQFQLELRSISMNMFMRFQAGPASVSWSQDFKNSMFCRDRQSDRSDFNEYHRQGMLNEDSLRENGIHLPRIRRSSYNFTQGRHYSTIWRLL